MMQPHNSCYIVLARKGFDASDEEIVVRPSPTAVKIEQLRHYTHVLLNSVYPLTRDEYRLESIHRRASYDYLNQIVQNASELVSRYIDALKAGRPKSPYSHRFIHARELGLLPDRLADDMAQFSRLRNMVVHENRIPNDSLEMYDKLSSLIIVDLALADTLGLYEAYLQSLVKTSWTGKKTIDRDYFLSLLSLITAREPIDDWEKQLQAKCIKAEIKLREERQVPCHTIDFDQVAVIAAHFR